MFKTILRLLPLVLLSAVLTLVSCEKEEIVTSDTQTEVTNPNQPSTTTVATSPVVSRLANTNTPQQSASSTGGIEVNCITIDFPFEFDVDGTVYTITDLNDLDTLFATALATATSADFVYPLAVTLEDGTSTTVADGDELATLVADCIPHTGWGEEDFPAFFFDDPDCISLAYPVNLSDLDGETFVAADAAELTNLLASNSILFFEFPLTVIDSAGATLVVADTDELFAILANCACPGNGGGHGGGMGGDDFAFILGDGCFEYNYPISVVDMNGASTSLADENELANALLSGQFVDFEYPFDLTLDADGSVVTINTVDDLFQVIFDCSGHPGGGNGGNGGGNPPNFGIPADLFVSVGLFDSCYSLTYPFDVTDIDGNTLTIGDETAAMDLLNTGAFASVSLPVTVESGGATVTIAVEDDYFMLLSTCQPGHGGGSGGGSGGGNPNVEAPAVFFILYGLDGSCYDLEYPFTIENVNGTTSTISDVQEANAYLQLNGDGRVVFPVDVTVVATGASTNLVDELAYVDLVNSCM